jgi:hypothetical protein
MGGSAIIPLRELAKHLAPILQDAFNDTPQWAVHIDFDYHNNRWVIVKVEPWVRQTKILRFPADIYRVEATDEMAAYTKMQRVLDKLETHSEGDNFRL